MDAVRERCLAKGDWAKGHPYTSESRPGLRAMPGLEPAELGRVERLVRQATGAKELWVRQTPGGGTHSGYLDSLERIGRLAPADVLHAHQHPFTDAPARVRELLAHHEERLRGPWALLTEPLTPWQLAERMEWNRPRAQIPYGSRNNAASEAEAHLRRLVKPGRAGRCRAATRSRTGPSESCPT